jgi:hypothetical protein
MDSPTVVEGEALALHPPFITQTPLPKITCRARPPERRMLLITVAGGSSHELCTNELLTAVRNRTCM